MVMYRNARGAMMAGAALALAQGSPLLAQDQGATATDQGSGESIKTTRTGDGDIVVTARHYVPEGAQTATKTDIPLIQTPQSITVITRDQIDLLRFVDAQQAVRYTAGVTGENYGNDPRYDFVTVRGFTPRQFIDGLAVPASTTIQTTGVDLYAFQSLDVLKGPASVLYGSAPPGGILNEVSRRPSSTFGGEARATYGTHDYKEFATTITGPATPFLDVRITALYRDRELDVAHTDDKRILAAPSATLKLGPDTKLTGLFYYQYDDDRGGAGGFLPIYGTLLANPNGRLPRSTNLGNPDNQFLRRQYGAGYELDHRFSDAIRFVSNAKWSHYKEQTPLGLYNAGGFINTTDPTDPNYFRDVLTENFTYQEKVVSFAIDNRLNAQVETGSIKHKLLVGVDYRNVRNDASYGFDFLSPVTLNAYDPVYSLPADGLIGYPTRYNVLRFKQTGVYAQHQLNLSDLYLTLSGRYDWLKSEFATNTFVSVVDPAVFDRSKQHKFTYRAGLSYVTPAGIAPYVSYATSFEPVLGTDVVTNAPFRPTRTRQVEAGVKFDARGLGDDVKLFATASVFDIREKNFVAAQANTAAATFSTQGGAVRVRGAEIEAVARIREQLSINASYSYTRSKVLSSDNAPGDAGFPLPTTPRNKAAAFVDYFVKGGPLAGFGLGGGVRYQSRSAGGLPSGTYPQLVVGQPIFAGKATLVDAIAHYDLPGWRFAVNASNLLDKRYVVRCAGINSCDYGAARQVLGTVTKRF